LSAARRKPVKEPAYKHAPTYCLLAFGPEAKFRVWVVLDGDTLYVDRNGDGDLTEEGERFKMRPSPRNKELLECELPDVVTPDTKVRYPELRIRYAAPDWCVASACSPFAHPKAALLAGNAYPLLSASPKNAPVVHFGGRLRMRLSFGTCGDRRSNICARIGTPGLGEGAFVDYAVPVLKLTDARPSWSWSIGGRRAAGSGRKPTSTGTAERGPSSAPCGQARTGTSGG